MCEKCRKAWAEFKKIEGRALVEPLAEYEKIRISALEEYHEIADQCNEEE